MFRLPGAEQERAIRLQNLRPERVYRVQGFEGELDIQMTGQELLEKGLEFSKLAEEESALFLLA